MVSLMRLILNCEPDDVILAGRAGVYLFQHPEKRDAILEFHTSKSTFTAVRRKSSISVLQQTPGATVETAKAPDEG